MTYSGIEYVIQKYDYNWKQSIGSLTENNLIGVQKVYAAGGPHNLCVSTEHLQVEWDKKSWLYCILVILGPFEK